MNLYTLRNLLILITYYISAQIISAQEPPVMEIGIEEKLEQLIPGDIQLITETGDTFLIKEILTKPTVLSLVYYRCPGICTPLMDGLAEVIKNSDLKIGKDYQVLTVSFNPKEGKELALHKKDNYINLLELQDARDGWMFCVSDSQNIKRLTESVGFRYQTDGNEFAHAGALIFVASDGKITRYLNGSKFLPFEFKMAVIETSRGVSGPTINKVLQFCFKYDPKGHNYTLNITRVAGGIITGILILFFFSLLSFNYFKKRDLNRN